MRVVETGTLSAGDLIGRSLAEPIRLRARARLEGALRGARPRRGGRYRRPALLAGAAAALAVCGATR
jgi:hypothetical protein